MDRFTQEFYDHLETMVERYKFEVSIPRESEKRGYSVPKNEVPKAFISLADFSRKYKFISSNGLFNLLVEEKSLEEAMLSISVGNIKKRYVLPEKVIIFMESGACKSARISNSYNKLKDFVPELKEFVQWLKIN